MFIRALQGLFILFILIYIGIFLSRKKLIKEEGLLSISNIVIKVAIPALLFNTIISQYTKENLIYIFTSFQIPLLCMLLLMLISFTLAKIFKIDKKNEGTFISMCSMSNTIFIGIPVATSILGSESTAYVSICYIVNTTLFWTLGVFLIKKDGRRIKGIEIEKKDFPSSVKSFIKYVFTLPVIVFILAVICVFLEIKIPSFIGSSLKHLGAIATPLAMIYIGASLYGTFEDGIIKNIKAKDLVIITIMRFVISPFVIYIMLKNTNLPHILKQTFILIAAMPVMNQTSILAKALGADDKYVSVATVVTSALLPLLLFCYVLLLSNGII